MAPNTFSPATGAIIVMRVRSAVSALAGGLVLGWAAMAQAASAAPPPAAPIFYCPKPATPATTTHQYACPTHRLARAGHHGRRHHGERELARSGDVSASQAFIYHYERLHHGFDARAADAAWREHDVVGDHDRASGSHDLDDRGDADARVRRDDGGSGERDEHRLTEDGHGDQIDRMEHMDRMRHMGDGGRGEMMMDHMGPDGGDQHAFGYEEHGASAGARYGYTYERREGGSSHGWTFDGGDVRGRHWSSDDGWTDGGHGHDGHGEDRYSWNDGGRDGRDHSGGWRGEHRGWYDADGEGYGVAGRDAHGYLVWPGKTPPDEVTR
ncbi:MAG: hypothetical protein ACHP7N_18105 [Caulobacterales bacterium]